MIAWKFLSLVAATTVVLFMVPVILIIATGLLTYLAVVEVVRLLARWERRRP